MPAPRSIASPRKKPPFVTLVLAGMVVATLLAGIVAVVVNRPVSDGSTFTTTRVAAVTPTVTEEKEVPATATFDFQSRASGYKTSFYVLGFVTNTSPFPIDKPKVTAVFHDGQKRELGTREGFAESDTLEPQARSPIKLLVSDPPAFTEMTFEVVARKSSYHADPALGLTVEVLQPPHPSIGTWEITGKVHNGGKQVAKFVNVRALAYDAAGKLVGVDSTFADGEALPTASDARFRLTPLYDSPPRRFEYAVSGQL